ncbi:hypothetical protein M9H77_22162 [Catharanthus roseus]|uniref:Uncharacterized protein n=1 Tax=Catharanthus roseus TaxID=4058 RepID=A0ACC0AQL6_CATRO|nr:hypothetical protein M9H77_22162 [Catharanthus roseus]
MKGHRANERSPSSGSAALRRREISLSRDKSHRQPPSAHSLFLSAHSLSKHTKGHAKMVPQTLKALSFGSFSDELDSILVSSTSLEKFDIKFNSLPSLLEVYIDVDDVYVDKEVGEISYANSVAKLIQGLEHANSLILTHNTIKYFGNATASFPKLPGLSKLAIKVICYQWNNLINFVESSVHLETLILQKELTNGKNFMIQAGEILQEFLSACCQALEKFQS